MLQNVINTVKFSLEVVLLCSFHNISIYTLGSSPVVCTHGNLNTHCDLPGYTGATGPQYINHIGEGEGRGEEEIGPRHRGCEALGSPAV